MIPHVLTIAGSDSSGGAGIQRDLRVFQALGIEGLSAVTSITAQSRTRIELREDIGPDLVVAQIRAVAQDGIDAVKTGMLATAATVEAVAEEISALAVPLVVDPVFTSSSGTALLDPDAVDVMRTKLFPLADCVTPNAAEAELLTGIAVDDLSAQKAAARAILDLGVRAVVVTGGHLPGTEVVDLLGYGGGTMELRGPRLGGDAHGTGCAFSAALIAFFALGLGLEDAATAAKKLVEDSLRESEPA